MRNVQQTPSFIFLLNGWSCGWISRQQKHEVSFRSCGNKNKWVVCGKRKRKRERATDSLLLWKTWSGLGVMSGQSGSLVSKLAEMKGKRGKMRAIKLISNWDLERIGCSFMKKCVWMCFQNKIRIRHNLTKHLIYTMYLISIP